MYYEYRSIQKTYSSFLLHNDYIQIRIKYRFTVGTAHIVAVVIAHVAIRANSISDDSATSPRRAKPPVVVKPVSRT